MLNRSGTARRPAAKMNPDETDDPRLRAGAKLAADLLPGPQARARHAGLLVSAHAPRVPGRASRPARAARRAGSRPRRALGPARLAGNGTALRPAPGAASHDSPSIVLRDAA